MDPCVQCIMVLLFVETNPYYHDDRCVVTFIQGCLFRVMERHDEAEKCFLDVIGRYAYFVKVTTKLL